MSFVVIARCRYWHQLLCVAGQRQHVQLVIKNEARLTRRQRQHEPLVEPANNVAVGFGTKSRVHILRSQIPQREVA